MKDSDLIRKIRALLALGQSPNQAEAFSAITKARKLMADHNIAEVQLQTFADTNDIQDNRLDLRIRGPWQRRLAGIIAQNFRCRIFFHKINQGVNVCFYGHRTDGEIASETFKFTLEALKAEATSYTRLNGISGKPDFILGFLNGLQEAFKDQNDAWSALNETALVVISRVPKEVQEAYQKRSRNFNRTINNSMTNVKGDTMARASGYTSGYSHGNSLGKALES
jgi:hypothetical protein